MNLSIVVPPISWVMFLIGGVILVKLSIVVLVLRRRRRILGDADDRIIDVTRRYGLDEAGREQMIRDTLVLVEAHLRAGRSLTLRYRNERQAPGT